MGRDLSFWVVTDKEVFDAYRENRVDRPSLGEEQVLCQGTLVLGRNAIRWMHRETFTQEELVDEITEAAKERDFEAAKLWSMIAMEAEGAVGAIVDSC